VDASLYGSVVGPQAWEIDLPSLTGRVAPRAGTGHPFLPATWGTYATADGWIVLGGVYDDSWQTFCEVMDMTELVLDERFSNGVKRLANSQALYGLVGPRLRTRTTAEWMERFVRLRMLATPVQSYAEILEDPQAQENGYIVAVDDPRRGPVKIVGCPIKFSETPAQVKCAAPELGQHTEEVLREMGYTWEQIAELGTQEAI
jgi:crotonobetainyl-CoA:carnitine CoA-transferase CaiB-like acyl-CoA transferase